ncbi:hypothetical protein Pelo_8461 [Pelomyxa schiedti]|nr:hypothetical protein Pelo_8461 [Pelomyxa schiedti]
MSLQKEGYLYKPGKHNHSLLKKRFYMIQRNLLLRMDSAPTSVSRSTLKPKESISLSLCTVSRTHISPLSPFGIILHTLDGNIYELFAKDEEEVTGWVQALQAAAGVAKTGSASAKLGPRVYSEKMTPPASSSNNSSPSLTTSNPLQPSVQPRYYELHQDARQSAPQVTQYAQYSSQLPYTPQPYTAQPYPPQPPIQYSPQPPQYALPPQQYYTQPYIPQPQPQVYIPQPAYTPQYPPCETTSQPAFIIPKFSAISALTGSTPSQRS